MDFKTIKKRLFISIGLPLLFVTIALIFLSILNNPQKQPKVIRVPTPTPFTQNNNIIYNRNITDNTIITPNRTQTFIVYFDNKINISSMIISLSKNSIYQDAAPVEVEVKSKVNEKNNSLEITTLELVSPASEYKLVLKDKATGEILYSKIFLSDKLIPTRVPSNNLSLATFLPYETNSFKLSYFEEANIYIFNFLYDPNSPIDIDEQLKNAKTQALEFIKSKGIDPNTVVIEWKSH